MSMGGNHCSFGKKSPLWIGEKPYKCSFCDKKFSKSLSVKRHENSHYTDFFKNFVKSTSAKFQESKQKTEKRFTCKICKQCFYDKHHLITHQR